jgi:hypothetical protein
MKGFIAAFVVASALVVAPTAGAGGVEKQWVCHDKGTPDDQWALIDVPTDAQHFRPNKDHFPSDDGDGHKHCGKPEEPPTPPFNGKLDFQLVLANCPDGQIGVPGFTVTETSFKDGESMDDDKVIFEYPTTCIPVVPGPPGPAGPTGPAGANAPGTGSGPGGVGSAGVPGKQGQSVKRCKSRRSVTITLPKSFKGTKSVRVTVGSKVKIVAVKGGKVKVSLKGIREGSAAIRIKRGKLHFVRQYAVCNEGNLTGINVPVAE